MIILFLLFLAQARVSENCQSTLTELQTVIDAGEQQRCTTLLKRCVKECRQPGENLCFDSKLACDALSAKPAAEPPELNEPAPPVIEESSPYPRPTGANPKSKPTTASSGCKTIHSRSCLALFPALFVVWRRAI